MKKKDYENPSYLECQKVLAKHPIKTESKRVVVAFADIVGFGPWIKRAHALSDFHFLVTQLYRKLIYLRDGRKYHVKFLGDGGMILREMISGHNCGMVLEFLRDMACLENFMTHTISKTIWPRPSGFRIRLAAGNVSKLHATMCKIDCSFQKDYIGYPVNLASRMLEVFKSSTSCICHESVKDIIGPRKAKASNIAFKKLLKPHYIPDGVDEEDLNHLWEFRFEEKS